MNKITSVQIKKNMWGENIIIIWRENGRREYNLSHKNLDLIAPLLPRIYSGDWQGFSKTFIF